MRIRNEIQFPRYLFWVPSAIVIGTTFVVLHYYRANFTAEPSTNTQDWANFGCFFSGLLGPVISFTTLLLTTAVLFYTFKAVQHAALSDQKAILHQLLMVWLSESMAHDRHCGWDWFEPRRKLLPEGVVLLEVGWDQANTEKEKKQFESQYNVFTFFVTVSTLVYGNAADETLAQQLFGDFFRNWMGLRINTRFSDIGERTMFKDFMAPAIALFGASRIYMDDEGNIHETSSQILRT